MDKPQVVTVRGLRKAYGDRVVVDGLDLDVPAGEIVGLIGANGAGKTTTVECIQGLRKPDAGILRVLGYDPVTQAGERRGTAAAVPGPRPAEPATAGHPGRADPGPGPGGAAGRVGRRTPAARRGHHGPARDPRDGRGRGAVRPGRGDARGTRTRRGGAGGPGGSARRDGDDPLQHAGRSGATA